MLLRDRIDADVYVGVQWALLTLALFNALTGNVDAHAKNISFFCSRAGLSTAPAVSGLLAPVRDQVAAQGGEKALLDRLCAGIEAECRRLQVMAPDVRELLTITLGRTQLEPARADQ